MRGDFTLSLIQWKKVQERRLKSALIRFDLGRDVSPLLSGIDSAHGWFKMKPIAVEAFGQHLKGADASVPFFGGFFGNS